MIVSESAGLRLFLAIFGGVAVLLLVIAATIAFFTLRSLQQTEERVLQISIASAAAIADSPIGREVAVEGRISPRMRPSHGDLVAFYSVLPSDDSDDSGVNYGPEAFPPLLIETRSGTIEVRGNYQITVDSRTLPGEEATQYYGVAVGETVAVLGTVAPTVELPALNGELVFRPPASRYGEILRTRAGGGWIGVAICGLLGLVFAGFTLLFRRVFADTV